MYKELEKWMIKKNISKAEISRITNIRYETLLIKLNGRYPLTLEEAKLIKDAIMYKGSLDDLFLS